MPATCAHHPGARMSEPTEPTQPTPPVTPGDATPEAPPAATDGAATPPPPPTTTWSTGAPGRPAGRRPTPPAAAPTPVGRPQPRHRHRRGRAGDRRLPRRPHRPRRPRHRLGPPQRLRRRPQRPDGPVRRPGPDADGPTARQRPGRRGRARCPWAPAASTPTATTGPAATRAELPDGVDPEHAVHADHHARGRGHLSDPWVNAGSPDTGAPARAPRV